MTILISVLAFVTAISILVGFHEFGHFWVAKRLGVKVLKFSIGFGKPLWKRTYGPDRTEYVIAAIPLGGYVKMLDEREGQVDASERERAFNRQPVGKRIAIVAAGPLANFLLAVVAYWLMFMLGVSGVKPVIGDVAPDSIAARAGIERGDEIMRVNGERTPTWEAASIALIEQALEQGDVSLSLRDEAGVRSTHKLDLNDTREVLGDDNLLSTLGITPWQPAYEAVLGELTANGPAERGGLRTGDRIVRADGRPIANWEKWVNYVRARPDQNIKLDIERDGQTLLRQLRTDAERDGDAMIGRIGAYPRIDQATLDAMRVEVSYNPISALGLAASRTWELSVLTVRVLWKLVTGEASLKNVSGPITIAEYAGVSAAIGVSAFLGALAIFSISIGILNLLPVPILDGGHLLYYFIELVKGSPVSESFEAMGQRIGLAALAGLMALAFYNDFSRLLG
ncbi:MAG: RIP metalloprotease RseP [Gammaproteobacteria bacterium]